jgi:hypothetical protein
VARESRANAVDRRTRIDGAQHRGFVEDRDVCHGAEVILGPDGE